MNRYNMVSPSRIYALIGFEGLETDESFERSTIGDWSYGGKCTDF